MTCKPCSQTACCGVLVFWPSFTRWFFTEGIGVHMQQRWTELLMIFATAGLIPLEVRNVWHHPGFDSPAKAAWSDKLHMANASEYHWICRGSMLPGKSSCAASLNSGQVPRSGMSSSATSSCPSFRCGPFQIFPTRGNFPDSYET